MLYPGVQMASVLGLTDLFSVADRQARAKRKGPATPLLRVTHWQSERPDEPPKRVFDTVEGAAGAPAVLILPPALGDPISREAAGRYAAWLREGHGAADR